jgi:hypothetical protein
MAWPLCHAFLVRSPLASRDITDAWLHLVG